MRKIIIRYYISEIEIEGFRGINNEGMPLVLKFDENKVNSIFAPNGSGKSSIFDALCFAIKGYIPRLNSMSRDENPDDYYINKFHSTKNSIIKLKFKCYNSGSTVSVCVKYDKEGNRDIYSPDISNPNEFLKQFDHDYTLVDYHIFNDFISNSSLERGRSFSSLVGLSKISSLKQCMDSLNNKRNLNNDFQVKEIERDILNSENNIKKCIDKIHTIITKLGGHAIEPFNINFIETFVMEKLATIPMFISSIENIAFNEINCDELLKKIDEIENDKLNKKLTLKLKEKNTLSNLIMANLEKKINEFNEIYNILSEVNKLKENTSGDNIYNLLKAALSVFEKEQWDKTNCPLCHQYKNYNDNTTLYDNIVNSLNDYEQIEILMKNCKEIWENSPTRKHLLKIEDYLGSADYHYFKNINKDFMLEQINIDKFCEFEKHAVTYNELILGQLKKIENEIKEIQDKLPSSIVEAITLIQDTKTIKNSLEALEIEYKIKKEKESELKGVKSWIEFVNEVTNELSRAETALNASICNQIETQACSFFHSIMGNSDISLSLNKSEKSQNLSLELSNFYNKKNIDATPVLSESYRNAMAISIFLAASLLQKTPAKFMILDDITSSFDSGNQFMLMDVLKSLAPINNDSNGLQIIILSHDGLLEKYFDRQVSTGESWKHMKLNGLPPHGNIITNTQKTNRLKTLALQHINSGSHENAYPLIRQYLEFQLTEVIKKLNIYVPIDFAIRDDKKMVSNCINAIESMISLYKNSNKLILSTKQLKELSLIHTPSIICNWVNHYETSSISNFTPNILINVINSIDEYVDCFKYDCKCSGKTKRRYYKSLSSKHCNC